MFHKSILTTLILLSSFALVQPVLAEGNAKKGKKVFKKCKACHSVKEDQHKVGPSMFNIVGKTAGTVTDFKYSKAMVDSKLVWDDATLAEFIRKPKELIPGTKMSFSGLKKDKDVENLVAYLISISTE